MTCREARELADPFLSDQLLVETTNEIVRHLETCPACRAEFEARRRLRTRLRSAVDAAPALAATPEFVAALTARLRPAEATEDITRRAWLKTWMAAAAAAVVAVGGGLLARDEIRRRRLASLAAGAAGDHQNCAIKFNLAEQPIPLDEAARRYDPAYATLATMTLPSGVVALARHSCVFEGRRFGHVVFKHSDHVVSLLVTAGDGRRKCCAGSRVDRRCPSCRGLRRWYPRRLRRLRPARSRHPRRRAVARRARPPGACVVGSRQ